MIRLHFYLIRRGSADFFMPSSSAKNTFSLLEESSRNRKFSRDTPVIDHPPAQRYSPK
jgi:hypothetical protein